MAGPLGERVSISRILGTWPLDVAMLAGPSDDQATWHRMADAIVASFDRIGGVSAATAMGEFAKLIFFDNVYMYGKVTGPMTEEMPFNPSSQKGEIRAKMATMLLDEIKAGGVRALIARSADFYGPAATTGD
jgi:hypothetical protein